MSKDNTPKARTRRYYNQNMKDRLPQYPNRFKVSGLGDSVDIVANPGTIGDLTATPMSGANIQKLEKGIEAIDTALLNLENLSDKFVYVDGSRHMTNMLTVKPSTSTNIVDFNLTANTTLKNSLIDSMLVYGGTSSSYGGDYVGLKANMKDSNSVGTYLIARARKTVGGINYLGWEMSTKYMDSDYLKNLNHVALIGNLYDADGSLNDTLASKIQSATNPSYIHDGSLGSSVQKIDLSSGTFEMGNFDNNDALKSSSALDFYSLYKSAQQEGYNYRAYAGFRYKFKNKKNEYVSSSYLDFFLNDLDEVRLEYSRDRNQKKFDKEVAVLGDLFNTNATSSEKASNKFIERRIIDPLNNQANNTLVWKGVYFLQEGQICNLNLPYLDNIGLAPKIVLKFSDYNSANGAAGNFNVAEHEILNGNDADYGGAQLDFAGQLSSVACFVPGEGYEPHKIFSFDFDQTNNKLVGFTPKDSANFSDSVIREIWIVNQ